MSHDFNQDGLSPSDIQDIYQRGIAAYETGRYSEAIALLESLGETRGLAANLAHYYLGQAHMRLGMAELSAGRHAEAARHFNAARAINPNAASFSKHISACYAADRRFDLAASELEREQLRAGDESPRQADLPIRLAHAFARDGQQARAVETLVEVIHTEPSRIDVRIQLGLLYAAAEEFEDAICIFQEAAELAPLDADVRRHLGLALAAAGEHAEAIEHLAVAQRMRPNDAYLALLLTFAVDAAGTTCIKLAIQPATGELEMVDDRSLNALGDVIAGDPNFVEAFLSLPETGLDSNIFALLAEILKRSLECHPDFADLHYHCSRVLQRLGQAEPAIDQAHRAIELNPRYVQALIQLGRLYADTDRSREAIDRFRGAIACGGDYPDVHFMLGQLYHRIGDPIGARDAYQRALELNADFTRAREALAAVHDA